MKFCDKLRDAQGLVTQARLPKQVWLYKPPGRRFLRRPNEGRTCLLPKACGKEEEEEQRTVYQPDYGTMPSNNLKSRDIKITCTEHSTHHFARVKITNVAQKLITIII